MQSYSRREKDLTDQDWPRRRGCGRAVEDWNQSLGCALKWRNRLPIFVVDYESLFFEEKSIERLFRFLELTVEDQVLERWEAGLSRAEMLHNERENALTETEKKQICLCADFDSYRKLLGKSKRNGERKLGRPGKASQKREDQLGLEVRLDFVSHEDWLKWAGDNQFIFGPRIRKHALERIKRDGFIDPLTKERIKGEDVKIGADLGESISFEGINSRKRAVLLALEDVIASRREVVQRRLRIFAPEGITDFALRMRGLYPYFIGSEYLPTKKDRERFFPIQHQDLQGLQFDDGVFDLTISNAVFEHVPDLDMALRELHRVLAVDGYLIASFPFRLKNTDSLRRARLREDGSVEHLLVPETHGNPTDPGGGALVFEIPGWDIVDRAAAAGFRDARMTLFGSMRYGIVGSDVNGVFLLICQKTSETINSAGRPLRRWRVRNATLEGLVGLIGLPRSGTTLATAMIGAHSEIHPVYEPWNGTKKDPRPTTLGLDEFLTAFAIRSGDKKYLLVKETSTKKNYLEGIDALLASALPPFRRCLIWLVRNPYHVYLSETEARKKWWDMVELDPFSPDTFEKWGEKTLISIRSLFHLVDKFQGVVVSYEHLVHNPFESLQSIMECMKIPFEPEQLQYYETIDRNHVRGDKNVATSPREATTTYVEQREREFKKVTACIRDCRAYPAVEEFADWCAALEKVGLSLPGDDMRRRLREIAGDGTRR